MAARARRGRRLLVRARRRGRGARSTPRAGVPRLSVFVDTSALYALLDRDDARHTAAATAFRGLGGDELVTHSYVLVEAAALAQRRLGPAATRALLEELTAPLEVVWVDEGLHRSATTALLAAIRRKVSLVDWVSFEVMRRRRLRAAFAFDRDFAVQGFETIP